MQFKAGYIADSIAKVITDFKATLGKNNDSDIIKLLQIDGLLQYVSSFEVKFPHEQKLDFHETNPVLATINNIITRGLPTRLPVSIEYKFSKIGLTEPNKDEYEFNFPIAVKQIKFETIFQLLHILEPKLEINKNQYGGFPSSLSEWKFLDETLKEYPFAKQILQSQRDFSTIGKGMAGGKSVDFSYEFPYQTPKKAGSLTDRQKEGIIFEFDGPHHKRQDIKYYDKYRDDVADEDNFETLRQASDLSLNPSIGDKFKEDIFKIFETNYHRNFKEYLEEYSLLYIPLAVARIQKTIIELFLRNKDLLKKETLKIAIIERDLPCGAIAIESLQDYFENINAILEDKDKLTLPKIDLTIFENQNWVTHNEIHLNASIKNEEYFKLTNFDIIIDHSILRRSDIYNEIDFNCDNAIKIRSSHYFDTNNGRKIYCANLLNYKSLVEKKDDGSYIPINEYEKNINFFIQNIFRKVGFRDGQLPIISRALQQKPVIGLLPTGGGKSLTFQLPTFLQPGLCLVVDPIKSLMEDQVRVLKQNWIDCCDFINSNLKREEKAKKLIDFRFGETMFLFVSPERFVMEDFRSIIKNIGTSKFGLAFSYCVIDEVHCVSEWGHDFRTTYLMLGKNAQKFAATKNPKNDVSLIGLTATASFDVLADIERELQIEHSDVANAIIMIENTIRPELFFRIIDVTVKNRIDALNEDFEKIGENLSKINSPEILKQSLIHHYVEFENLDYGIKEERTGKYSIKESAISKIDKEFHKLTIDEKYLKENKHKKHLENLSQNDFSSIVFCPVKGEKLNNHGEWANPSGVRYVYSQLNSNSKGFFFASDNDTISDEVHKHFIDFTTDKTKHIVCTKAFGMGIDKKDIRSTYHYFYSGSLESLVQEAGRSGRDKKISEANILISKAQIISLDYECLLMESKDDITMNPIKNTFHRSQIRRLVNKPYFSREDCNNDILNTINNLKKFVGGIQIELSEGEKENLFNRCQNFIKENYQDRNIHNFFYQGSFKGVDTEISQYYSLFREKEFIITSKLKEFNDEFNFENNVDYLFRLWSRGAYKRLYVSDYDENDLGFISLSLPLDTPRSEILLTILAFLREKNGRKDDVFNLFTEEIIDNTLNEGTFIEMFNKCETDEFSFKLASEKIFPDNFKTILKKIAEKLDYKKHLDKLNELYSIDTNFDKLILETRGRYQKIGLKGCSFHIEYDNKYISKLREAFEDKVTVQEFLMLLYEIQIERSFNESKGSFLNFLLLLEEKIENLKFSFDKNNQVERWLKLYYNRSRYKADTGKLIYRMHSMGLLIDYTIDYNKNNLFNCTFRRFDAIESYIIIIENYLKRYLSENTAIEIIKELKERVGKKDVLIDKILECLYFLAEFSYKEIATKRTRATKEIEDILNKSVTDEVLKNDWFKQNLFIKEEIYFYFNAKYARKNFKIEGNPYSLLDDFQDQTLSKSIVLEKYLGVFNLEGTEQNNYKHMTGSCKKILRSLSEGDLNKEWLLRLLKAFSMYSVNNASYISEANEELEKGFIILYGDTDFHENNYEIINEIFQSYFNKLSKNILATNDSFKDIRLIRAKILINIQTMALDNLILKNNKLRTELYA